MKIAVTAESTIDLPKRLLEEFDIHTVPFMVTMGDRSGLDGEVTPEEEFAYTKETGKLPHTAAVNPFQFEEFFANILKEYDHIIHFSLSSGISKACENATLVSHQEAFEGKVDVIDTLSLSTGIALQAIYACKLVKEGEEVAAIIRKCKARIPHCQASFSLESVDNLYKGGRCSALSMIGANLLRIKPEIYVQNGKMIAGKKYRGSMDAVVGHYVDDTLEAFPNPDRSLVFITYSTATEEAVNVAKEKLAAAGFKRIECTTAGATIACYCGPHCLGILYINDGGKE